MAYSIASIRSPKNSHNTKSPSPLRHAATVSDSEDEDTPRRGLASLSRASTYTTNTQFSTSQTNSGHTRGTSDISPTKTFSPYENTTTSPYVSPTRQSRTVTRQTLGDLPQASNVMAPIPSLKPGGSVHSRAQSFDAAAAAKKQNDATQQPPSLSRAISRRDPGTNYGARPWTQDGALPHQPSLLDDGDLEKLGRSATGHLRTISKLAEEGVDQELAIRTKEHEVVGLHGRRKLQGNMVTKERPLQAPGYGGRIWLDQQRQFLQAYEYLCHIGEAKEWIQDVMRREIPAIVQLEEHLRDGVTLAELVQSLHPERPLRIFRNAKLQFRHSDNIAIFFNFLAEIELPELFRFELVDLYEKKNIPKVIYCIHALSWLLFRKGIVDFKIGNLVGQLEFEQHELENMQKGLDQSGISMPNFSGLRPEPVEPVETEEDRIDRELQQHTDSIQDFQAQLRGALLRLRLGEQMQVLFENEDLILDLQARLRGDWSRQVHGYQLEMKTFATKLQSAVRAYIARTNQKDKARNWQHHESDVVRIQALVRARQARKQTQLLKSNTRQHTTGIVEVQAAIRGALKRLHLGEHYTHVHEHEASTVDLQRHIRGYIQRQRHEQRARDFESLEPVWAALQGHARGMLVRTRKKARSTQLDTHAASILSLQTQVRARRVRMEISQRQADLAGRQAPVTELQSALRAFLVRKRIAKVVKNTKLFEESITEIQSQARGVIYRARLFDLLKEMKEHDDKIVGSQALALGALARMKVTIQLEALQDSEVEVAIVELQALARAQLVRKNYVEKQHFFQENMKKVIKIQSIVRAKQQGQAYKSLTTGKNPPVGTVKNFVHLLNDSDFDFEEEIESEKLQQSLVRHIQTIERLEAWIAEMDAKIGLLAHNKIASDEAARLRHQPNSAYRNTPSRDSFNSRALNKNSRTKLDRYQELFFILQTQPQFLARLLRKSREQGATEADMKRLESLVMSTFAHAQKQREEYYLLKLFSRSIEEEIGAAESLQHFRRGNYCFDRLFNSYTRVPRDRKFIRQAFGVWIKEEIVEATGFDLETDPLKLYRAILDNEQLNTGRTTRDPNMSRDMAIQEQDVRDAFIGNLQYIREHVERFLELLEDNVSRLPYGVRYMTKQMFDILSAKCPGEEQHNILQVAGFWLWKIYIKPSLADPEGSGLVDRGLDVTSKRNLNVILHVLNQVAIAKLFGQDQHYLRPLNALLQDTAIPRLQDLWAQVIDVSNAEIKFDIGQFNDYYAKTKPTLYIKMSDVFAMHSLVANAVSSLCSSQEDNSLRDVLRELGSAKANEAEMSAGQAEVTLSLGGRMHTVEDPDAEIKAMFMETKRCVLYIIRIQTGSNLMEVMIRPVTAEDEDRWDALVREELSTANDPHKRNAYTEASHTLVDITSLTYPEIKSIALRNLIALEERGRLTRENNFQDLLNEIAVDIRNKHRRRVQRQHELETVKQTITHLEAKQCYLQEKLDAYNNTYEQSLTTLQSKSARRQGAGALGKKMLNPFGKQATHLRELARRGEEPRFGSYKYSAAVLQSKGILLSWEGRNLREDDVTVSSDAINEFVIEGSRGQIVIPGAVSRFTWDELLEAEYEGRETIEFFGGNGGAEDVEGYHGGGGSMNGGAGVGRKSIDVRRGKSVDMGPRRGVLRVDRKAFGELLSKKFWREAS